MAFSIVVRRNGIFIFVDNGFFMFMNGYYMSIQDRILIKRGNTKFTIIWLFSFVRTKLVKEFVTIFKLYSTRKYPLRGYILGSGAPGTPGVNP